MKAMACENIIEKINAVSMCDYEAVKRPATMRKSVAGWQLAIESYLMK